jgi:superfamily II DNA or RNA helicase
MARVETTTLILSSPTIVSARQWAGGAFKRTTLTADEIGEYPARSTRR